MKGKLTALLMAACLVTSMAAAIRKEARPPQPVTAARLARAVRRMPAARPMAGMQPEKTPWRMKIWQKSL